jgi:putative ABC transport system permease protein
MSPQRLALRTLLQGRPRSVLTMLAIGSSLCLLDLYAGHLASVHARLEYQAVIGERLGHLSIARGGAAAPGAAAGAGFDPDQAATIRRLLEAAAGVALVLPQMSVSGIAASASGALLFRGEGIGAPAPGAALDLPPRFQAEALGAGNGSGAPAPTGVALSSGAAHELGLGDGGQLTLIGAAPASPAVTLTADVIDVFSTAQLGRDARALLMPLAMAQTLRENGRTERLVVFLSDPRQLESRRAALQALLRGHGVEAVVTTWQERSDTYRAVRGATEQRFGGASAIVLTLVAACIGATISMNALDRRREVATLRALGMRAGAVFRMFSAEALWTAAFGVALSLVASGSIAWLANRLAPLSGVPQLFRPAPMLVELDFRRMALAVLAVLVVALLAALAPALKAARGELASGLAA